MCGVVGFFAYGSRAAPIDREELRAVRDHMAARGPDGSGEWYSPDGRCALGHRRLAIIDLSERGAQPMASRDGSVVVSFNGEIYNHAELRRALERDGCTFASDSDTEVLLQLYERHGSAMLPMLRGMFAFALWDGRRRAMLLARDPLGIKLLYYADGAGTLRAASQVKALLQAAVDTAPDPAGHAGFFLWGSVPNPWTLYRGIRALPAGHFLWATHDGVQPPQAYCRIEDVLAHAAEQEATSTPREALEAVAHALRGSINAHLVSDVPVGVFLSSGLDSALIASLVAARGVSPSTVTLGFAEYRGTAEDETLGAESLARAIGAQHATVLIGKADFAGDRERLLAAMDQPSIDGVNTWFVARAAASQGLKVALSGIGGDELFGSYPSFRQIPLLNRAVRPISRVPMLGLGVRKLTATLVRPFASPKYAGLIEYGGTAGGAYLLRRGLHMPWELPSLMDPDMARAGWRALEGVARVEATAQAIRDPRLAISALEMSWYMRHQLLADADWAGMAHSLEIRVPFADVTLIRECAPHLAAHRELAKRDFAAAAAPQLPAAVLDRPKTGFNVPVRDWLGAPAQARRGLRGWGVYVYRRQWPKPPACAGTSPARRVLISTLAPGNGGVSAMTAFAVRTLVRHGFEPVIAHYATYSAVPTLSVPSFKLLQRVPGHHSGLAYDGREIHAIGAWLPELEFTHYAPTAHWRDLMDSCDAHLAVSGNVLAATPFWATRRPYLAWVATDWEGDRRDRVRRFPWPRKIIDRCINAPVIRRLERALLRGGHIVPLSEYTARMLDERAGKNVSSRVLCVPVDSDSFTPDRGARIAGRVGFAGRFNDPRKNVVLMLEAVAALRRQGHEITAVLIGDTPHASVRAQVSRLELGSHVSFRGGLSRQEMRECLQSFDVFVLPSHQEGLCISALEAMACGVPVVSTRCGGPEEFVIPGTTGDLVSSDAREMAAAIARIVSDGALRERLSSGARRLVEERYSSRIAEAVLWGHIAAAFPALARAHAAHRPVADAAPALLA